MRFGVLVIIGLFFLTACRNRNKVPADVLPPAKMKAVLWDIMRADQLLAGYVLNKDSALNKTTESLKYYQQVFAIHTISRDEFQHSFSWYREHPVLFRAILDSINGSKAIEPDLITPVVAPVAPGGNTPAPRLDTLPERLRKKPLPVE